MDEIREAKNRAYEEEKARRIEEMRGKKGFICDMDGVIYHGNRLLPGVKEFVEWLYKENKNFLFLTNASERSPKELQLKLKRMGLDVDEKHFYDLTHIGFGKFIRNPVCHKGCAPAMLCHAFVPAARSVTVSGGVLQFFRRMQRFQ